MGAPGRTPVLALVALGSNLAPRRDSLRSALKALARLPDTRLVATSALRETEPLDCPAGSENFVNGAVLLETGLSPEDMLDALLAIEAEHGRRRDRRNAPRQLDLDLIVHGEALRDGPRLTLPHPAAHRRLFVLEPAADLLPEALHPRLGRSWIRLRDEFLAAQAAGSGSDGHTDVDAPSSDSADA